MMRKSGPSPYVLQAGGHRFDPGRLHFCNLLYNNTFTKDTRHAVQHFGAGAIGRR